MGDRCLVDLTILTVHLDKVLTLTDGDRPNQTSEEDDCTVLSFEEVNYGTLTFLGKLTAAGIAWDSRWHGGDEYGPGTKQLRFTADGRIHELEYADSELDVIPTKDLLEFLNRSGTVWSSQVKTFVEHHIASLQPLPWEDQEQNGKRYLALKLIGGT